MPEISIIIPVYNAEKFLEETLCSVANQTFENFECLIVNDGSTDKSLEIIESFIQKDNRFKCIVTTNSGCADIPIRRGINHSSANFVLIMGHDDYLSAECLEKQYNRSAETNADIVLLNLIGCKEELKGELYRLPASNIDQTKIYSGKDACSLTIGGWKFTCNGMLIKKELYNNIPVGNLMNSDEFTSRHLLYKANTVAFSDAIYYYRNHNNSISRAVSPRIFEKLIVDRQLEDFVNERYSDDTNISRQMRNARFFNLIYLCADFVHSNKHFSHIQRAKIKEIIREAYASQDFLKLKKELPQQFNILFLQSFLFFRMNALIYVRVKKLKGGSYILK